MDLKKKKKKYTQNDDEKAGTSGIIRIIDDLIIITDNIFIFNAILLVFFNTEIMHLINIICSK